MLKSKTFVKKTRSGGVLKIVREHYLRDDIWCGSEVCKECKDEAPVLQEETCIESNLCPYPHYLIPDTNVVLHQFRCRVWCFNPKIYNEGSIKLTEHQLKFGTT
nr:exosome complex exonuclease RRP44-like isoform X2 [Danio rerio]XP_021332783.1 exosome complex exonuclease RRP44-like isoform X2 [Danio rerio]|eukprot:XP_017212109.1 exosome complex exonuclease RRP44-like isoform X2 [Danio rerio]